MAGHNKELYVVVGPTAAGKTELGAALARKLGGAVVSADSRQVYAGMDVGTAKALPSKSKSQSPNDQQNPNGKLQMTNCVASAHDVFTPDIVDGVEQYLLNICEPDDRLTLAAWQKAALAVIDRLSARDATPLLVGGTMLYVDSVVRNYDIPQAKGDHAFRAQKETLGAEQLYRELIEKDPAARAFIQPHNKRRIIRALEVMAATGRPFSDQRQARPARYDATMIGLFPGWDQLGEAITRRAQQMLSGGLLDETRHLIDRFGRDLSLLQTINYRQALAVLAGEMTEQEALEEMVRANVRYARRQMSWWRGRREVAWYTGAAEAMREI